MDQEEAPSSTNSTANRQDKRFQITAGLTGLYGNSFISSVNGSYFLDPANSLFIEYSVGQGFYVGDDEDHESLATNEFAFGFKHFTGNSFYYRAGLSYTLAQYHQSTNDSLGNQTSDRRLEGNYTSVFFGVGNQWQFPWFTLGCDWVGISQPLFSNVTRNSASGDATTEDNESVRESHFVNSQLQIGHFYLGASF